MDRDIVGSVSEAVSRGRGILVGAFVLSFFVNILRLSGPMFMLLVYDRVLTSRSEESLVVLYGMVVVLLLSLAVIDYARRRILARFGAQFQERLETGMFARARHSDLFEKGRAKPLAGLDEVDGLRAFFHSSSLIAIYDFVWTPMFVVVIFVLDPLMGWVCLGAALMILGFVSIRMAFVGKRATASAEASKAIGDLKTMIATSRDTVRSQNMAQGFKLRWLAVRRNSRDAAIALKDWTVWFDSLCDFSVLFARYSVLAVGAWLTLEGKLTVGAMVAATFLVSRVLIPVEKFLSELPNIHEARGHWKSLKSILANGAAPVRDAFGDEVGNPRARLSLVNLSVRSPLSGAAILKSITLDIAPGQIVQITGMTGAGKTVLAETILGLWRRSGGTILINGKNLAQISDEDAAGLFGYVPENPSFFDGTLIENIARLSPGADPEKVASAARKACLHALISALPNGYLTRIDASASLFSRGQRYQLALARAVYAMPDLLIIDEPDPLLFQHIPKTMDKTFDQVLKRGGSVLILSRDRLALKQISVSYQLDDGKLKLLKPLPRQAPPLATVTAIGDKLPKDHAPVDAPVSTLRRG